MKGFLFFLLFIGLIFIVAGYVQSNQRCPPPVVVYRYVPRTFEEEQDNPTPLVSLFGRMFEEPDQFMQYRGYAMSVPESLQTLFDREVRDKISDWQVTLPATARNQYNQVSQP